MGFVVFARAAEPLEEHLPGDMVESPQRAYIKRTISIAVPRDLVVVASGSA